MSNRIGASKTKDKIINFIEKSIKVGDERGVIMSNVVIKWHISERTFARYWKKANVSYKEAQKQIKESILKDDAIKALEAEKEAIMTAIERKKLLTQLAKGEIKIPDVELKYDTKNGCWEKCDIEVLPSHQVRLNAISELNKMEGDYAPTKLTHEANIKGTYNILFNEVLNEDEITDQAT